MKSYALDSVPSVHKTDTLRKKLFQKCPQKNMFRVSTSLGVNREIRNTTTEVGFNDYND